MSDSRSSSVLSSPISHDGTVASNSTATTGTASSFSSLNRRRGAGGEGEGGEDGGRTAQIVLSAFPASQLRQNRRGRNPNSKAQKDANNNNNNNNNSRSPSPSSPSSSSPSNRVAAVVEEERNEQEEQEDQSAPPTNPTTLCGFEPNLRPFHALSRLRVLYEFSLKNVNSSQLDPRQRFNPSMNQILYRGSSSPSFSSSGFGISLSSPSSSSSSSSSSSLPLAAQEVVELDNKGDGKGSNINAKKKKDESSSSSSSSSSPPSTAEDNSPQAVAKRALLNMNPNKRFHLQHQRLPKIRRVTEWFLAKRAAENIKAQDALFEKAASSQDNLHSNMMPRINSVFKLQYSSPTGASSGFARRNPHQQLPEASGHICYFPFLEKILRIAPNQSGSQLLPGLALVAMICAEHGEAVMANAATLLSPAFPGALLSFAESSSGLNCDQNSNQNDNSAAFSDVLLDSIKGEADLHKFTQKWSLPNRSRSAPSSSSSLHRAKRKKKVLVQELEEVEKEDDNELENNRSSSFLSPSHSSSSSSSSSSVLSLSPSSSTSSPQLQQRRRAMTVKERKEAAQEKQDVEDREKAAAAAVANLSFAALLKKKTTSSSSHSSSSSPSSYYYHKGTATRDLSFLPKGLSESAVQTLETALPLRYQEQKQEEKPQQQKQKEERFKQFQQNNEKKNISSTMLTTSSSSSSSSSSVTQKLMFSNRPGFRDYPINDERKRMSKFLLKPDQEPSVSHLILYDDHEKQEDGEQQESEGKRKLNQFTNNLKTLVQRRYFCHCHDFQLRPNKTLLVKQFVNLSSLEEILEISGEGNYIGDRGLLPLLELCRTHHHREEEEQETQNKEETATKRKFCSLAPNLKSLRFPSNGISDHGAELIAEWLLNRYLHFHRNNNHSGNSNNDNNNNSNSPHNSCSCSCCKDFSQSETQFPPSSTFTIDLSDNPDIGIGGAFSLMKVLQKIREYYKKLSWWKNTEIDADNFFENVVNSPTEFDHEGEDENDDDDVFNEKFENTLQEGGKEAATTRKRKGMVKPEASMLIISKSTHDLLHKGIADQEEQAWGVYKKKNQEQNQQQNQRQKSYASSFSGSSSARARIQAAKAVSFRKSLVMMTADSLSSSSSFPSSPSFSSFSSANSKKNPGGGGGGRAGKPTTEEERKVLEEAKLFHFDDGAYFSMKPQKQGGMDFARMSSMAAASFRYSPKQQQQQQQEQQQQTSQQNQRSIHPSVSFSEIARVASAENSSLALNSDDDDEDNEVKEDDEEEDDDKLLHDKSLLSLIDPRFCFIRIFLNGTSVPAGFQRRISELGMV